jgi:BASS family bile acid:Na+ symporter
MEISVQQHLLPLVVISVMLTIGMELRWQQFQTLFAQPRVPVLGTLVHTLSFPLLAVVLIFTAQTVGLPMSDATIIGMLLIAACPSGGFSNILALMAGVNLPLSVVLTAVSSVLSFISVPLLMGGFSLLITELDKPIELPILSTLMQLLGLIVAPVGAGMIWRAYWPGFVERRLKSLQNIGQLALYLVVTAIVVESWEVVLAGVGEALPWSLLLCAANILICYQGAKLVGLEVEDRITVALEGSIRNVAVAFLIATSVLDRMDIAVLPTIYFVAVLLVAIVFAKTWRRLVRA